MLDKQIKKKTLLLGVYSVDCDLDPKTDEGRLRKNLLCKYDKENRPSLNGSATIVTMKMVVKGFNFVNIRNLGI